MVLSVTAKAKARRLASKSDAMDVVSFTHTHTHTSTTPNYHRLPPLLHSKETLAENKDNSEDKTPTASSSATANKPEKEEKKNSADSEAKPGGGETAPEGGEEMEVEDGPLKTERGEGAAAAAVVGGGGGGGKEEEVKEKKKKEPEPDFETLSNPARVLPQQVSRATNTTVLYHYSIYPVLNANQNYKCFQV